MEKHVPKYVFGPADIEVLYNNTKKMNENLKNAFEQSKFLFNLLETTTYWTGLSKEQLMAYYHLVLQYHGQLVGETVPSRGNVATVENLGDNVTEVEKALRELLERIEAFTDYSENFKKMENI